VKRAALIAALLVVLVALGGAVGFVLHRRAQAEDIRGSSTVEFVPTLTHEPEPEPAPGPGPAPKPVPATVAWPTYGYDHERLRFANGISLAPPFKRVWTFRAQNLVEFPPAVAYGRLYFANNSGSMFAISAKTGRRAWKFGSGRCQASSPAVDGHVVFVTFLNKPPCNAKKVRDGELIAFHAGSGRIKWRKRIGPSESSPVVWNNAVYVGDWTGRVYAFAARTGKLWWTFKTDGRVKGAVAISGGRVYVGSYDHHLYALNARSGKLVWAARSQPRFGKRGSFYATPAAAYGRVYVGATDGKMYSYGATSGKLRWSQSTGGYVYSSAAVWRRRVFAGSYSGRFFCFDAATGDILWKFKANGPISGSPSIIAGRVYFSTLKRRTYALDAKTGYLVWTFPDGKYSPVVADAKRLYLVGYTRVYALDERR
jgi:outer membrane protein assembly factor BamB